MLSNRIALGLIACTLGSFAAPNANAAFIETFRQVGGNVVATGSGTLNLLALGSVATTVGGNSAIVPQSAAGEIGGTPAQINIFNANITGPADFGPGVTMFGPSASFTNLSSGDNVGISALQDEILLPVDYVSNALLSNSGTFSNATFASLGLTTGAYLYTLTEGVNVDTFTIQIGPSAVAGVPEPASLALLGLGVSALALARRRRTR